MMKYVGTENRMFGCRLGLMNEEKLEVPFRAADLSITASNPTHELKAWTTANSIYNCNINPGS